MFFTAFKEIDTSIKDDEKFTIVIDAGHGGEDGGASGADGTLEKDINLNIALKLNELLTATGYNTVMTRTTDISIYDTGASTLREKKISDLHNRLAIFDDADVVLSIHQNNFGNSKYNGAQMYYSPNNDNSKLLAQALKNSVVELIQPDNEREIKPAGKDIFLLKNTTSPAVIAECGFLSNSDELSKLKNDDYCKQMAFSIYCGFLDYYNAINKG